jgi:hypothetical protein
MKVEKGRHSPCADFLRGISYRKEEYMEEASPIFLICHRGALGDFLLTWPALHGLRKILNEWRFMGIGRPEYMELAHSAGLIDTWEDMESARLMEFFEGRAIPPHIPPPDGAALWLKNGEDVARLFVKRSSMPVLAIKPFPGYPIHVARYHLDRINSTYPVSNMDRYCFSYPGRRDVDYAVIHPGSGSPAKNHSPDCYRAIADEMRRTGIERVAFLLGPAESRSMEAHLNGEWIVRPRNASDLAAWLAGAVLFVGNDSGVSHLAGMMGTPTVALYKKTDPRIWGVIGPRVRWIRAMDECTARARAVLFLRALHEKTDDFHEMTIPGARIRGVEDSRGQGVKKNH